MEFSPLAAIIGMFLSLPALVVIKIICDRHDRCDEKRVQRKLEQLLDARNP